MNKTVAYVGSGDRTKTEGIHIFSLDRASGTLSLVDQEKTVESATFLAIAPSRRYLYALNDDHSLGDPSGQIHAFAIEPGTGRLSYLDRRSTQGTTPCYLAIDQTEQYAIVTNFRGAGDIGSTTVLPIARDGCLGSASHMIQHPGASIYPVRQRCSHPHSATIGPANRFVIVADLGIDKMMIYRLDLERGKLVPEGVPEVSIESGSGPRNFCFHPSGRYAYLINELNSTVAAFGWDQARGVLDHIHTQSTLPEGFAGQNTGADIRVASSGTFIYGSNRGHDSIAIIAVDGQTGKLTLVDCAASQGSAPRSIALDPTGEWMLVANRRTNSVVVLHIDPQTGQLSPTGHSVQVPTPVCVQICKQD